MSSHTYGLHETDRALRSLVGEGDEGMVHMTIDPHRLDGAPPRGVGLA
jgi:hypothetical protein